MKPDYKISKNADYMNEICNHPEVNSGNGVKLDFSPLFENGIIYQYDGGCVFYVKTGDGVYEAHTQALKRARGAKLREFIDWTLSDLFNNQGAHTITSYALHENIPAKKLALEFSSFTHANEMADYYKLNREDYLCRQQN